MKIVCIYHSIDLDGFMSAAIVKQWFIKNNEHYMITNEERGITDKNCIGIPDSLHFIGYNYGQPVPDLSEYDKVIMCDISLPKKEMFKLERRLAERFVWVDHHISAIKDIHDEGFCADGIRDTNFAACELTWKYFFSDEPIPEIVELLGKWDNMVNVLITDKTEWLKVTEFQYGARQVITNYEEAYDELIHAIKVVQKHHQIERIWSKGKAIYQYLCTEAKQIYKSGFKIYFSEYKEIQHATCIEPTLELSKFICINKERFNPINFGIDYHKDGYDGAACFHYANGEWHFSLYNDNGLVDCSAIAKQYEGGGHKRAAGFRVKDINSVLKQL